MPVGGQSVIAEFREGDCVIKKCGNCNSAVNNKTYTVVIDRHSIIHSERGELAIGNDPFNLCHCQNEWELVTKSPYKSFSIEYSPILLGVDTLKNNNKSFMSNLIEKFALLTKSEPERSFIKMGVTNNDGTMTSEGMKLLLQYLLELNKADFNTKVVQPLLAEEEKNK